MSLLLARVRGNLSCQIYGCVRRTHLRRHHTSRLLGTPKVSWLCKSGSDVSVHTYYGRRARTLHGYCDFHLISSFAPSPRHGFINNLPVSLNPNCVYVISPAINNWEIRCLSTGSDPSSKIEETVRRLKEKHEDKLKEIQNIQDLDLRVKSVIELDQETDRAVQQIKQQAKSVEKIGKKTLWQRFVEEVRHYKSGFVLLFLDIRVASKIVWKMAKGNTLTRRENRQLVRTVGDLFRLVPFSVFVLVPFMEFLLPVALKLFPGMLPSTFTTKTEREKKFRQKLVAKIEYAKFLQKTLDEMAPTDTKETRSSESARDFVEFYRQIRESGKEFDNEQILKFSKLFEDDITLDNMTRGQLSAICRMLELPPIGTNAILAFSIEMRLRYLKADDKVIRREGLENMTVLELQHASKERGMRALGLTKEQLMKQLKEWLELSLNAKVPPSLLLLSRTLYMPRTLDPIAQLAATISALPESAASRTSAEIAIKEGKVRNVVKLEVIKEEQKKIEEEAREEQARIAAEKSESERKEKEAQSLAAETVIRASLDDATSAVKEASVNEEKETLGEATVLVTGEIREKEVLVDSAPVLKDLVSPEVSEDVKIVPEIQETLVLKESIQPALQKEKSPAPIPLKQRELSAEDFADLKAAIEKLGKVKTEIDTIGDIKKELEDYKEDVEDLSKVRQIVDRSGLKESKGARRLFSKVNKMLRKVDTLVETKEKLDLSKTTTGDEELDYQNNLVTINELIKAVQTSGTTLDSSKVEAMIEVLGLMDEDSDGVIKVDHVMKVIELLGTVHAKLPAKEIRQLVEMLSKEELLKVEENIENIMEKHSEISDADENFQRDLSYLEKAATESAKKSEAKQDATDLNLTEEKYNIKDIAKDMNEKSDVIPPHIEEVFSDKENHKTKKHTEESKRKLAQVKLSEKKRNGTMDLK